MGCKSRLLHSAGFVEVNVFIRGPGDAGGVGEGGCFGTSFSLVPFLAQGCVGSGNGPVGRSSSSAVSQGLGWAGLF